MIIVAMEPLLTSFAAMTWAACAMRAGVTARPHGIGGAVPAGGFHGLMQVSAQ